MDYLKPKQFQRRKLLVVLIISTPLLIRFPHSERASQMEERQERLPFHRRTRAAINYNTIENFKELSQVITELEQQATTPISRAERFPVQTRRSIRGKSSIEASDNKAPSMQEPSNQRMTLSAVRTAHPGGNDAGTIRPSPDSRNRKRVVRDCDDEGENIVVVKRKRRLYADLADRPSYLKTPPASIVDTTNSSTLQVQLLVEPRAPHKNQSGHIDDINVGKRTFHLTVDTSTSDGNLEHQLRSLLRLYQASLMLDMADLERAILEELDTSRVMTFEVFRSFRNMCFEGKGTVFVPKDSSLAVWIKRRQARYLFDLTGVAVKQE
ncbi:hypothetical protein Slin14017_G023280 [Septoria linicola]|nr:hypothetical protein Slin14017_G023280 [Septoria linicola]